jgi:hypothetical protein
MATKKQVTPVVEAEVKAAKPKTPRAKKPVAEAPVQITPEEADAMLDAGSTDLVTVVKETKRRKQSAAERDESGKVKRSGKNLSGNQPFRAKHYYYDLDFKKSPDYDKAFNAAPMQVRLIMRYMEENGLTTPEDAERGSEIAGGAINSGLLRSKIDPAALFAYYRRVMERLGLTLAEVE